MPESLLLQRQHNLTLANHGSSALTRDRTKELLHVVFLCPGLLPHYCCSRQHPGHIPLVPISAKPVDVQGARGGWTSVELLLRRKDAHGSQQRLPVCKQGHMNKDY